MIFEKEGIDTSDMNSEMILTCLSAFAQAESESISGNVTKGIRMGYETGGLVSDTQTAWGTEKERMESLKFTRKRQRLSE